MHNRTKIFSVLCPEGNKAQTAVEVGRRVLRLFTEYPETWGRSAMGINTAGEPTGLSSPELCRVCLAGAALLAHQPSHDLGIDGAAREFVFKASDFVPAGSGGTNLYRAIGYNDSATHISQVRGLIARTVISLEKKAATRQAELPLDGGAA
jgi:hypothetical protein